MIVILKDNESCILQIDKIQSEWWLELVEKKTGLCQILIFPSKQKARDFFKNCNLNKVQEYYNQAKVPKQKVYKAPYNPTREMLNG
jgi:hypothetical protein